MFSKRVNHKTPPVVQTLTVVSQFIAPANKFASQTHLLRMPDKQMFHPACGAAGQAKFILFHFPSLVGEGGRRPDEAQQRNALTSRSGIRVNHKGICCGKKAQAAQSV